jgi:hypothetical protein
LISINTVAFCVHHRIKERRVEKRNLPLAQQQLPKWNHNNHSSDLLVVM